MKRGTKVKRISGIRNGMKVGDKGTVLYSINNFICIKEFRGLRLHNKTDFKRVILCKEPV